jgi:hypothetical protein
MMMKLLTALVLGALLLPFPAFGQTAEKLDAVLDTRRVSFGQAALIILPAAGILPPDAGEEAAFARARDWLPRRAERDSPVKMGELSHLAMRSFGLSGGFMYALFPGPRYAYRALAWRRLLPPNADPGRFLSGEELLHVTGLLLSLAGEEEALEDIVVNTAADVAAEPPAPVEGEMRMDVGPGEGLSSGSEGVLPYRGDFEVE